MGCMELERAGLGQPVSQADCFFQLVWEDLADESLEKYRVDRVSNDPLGWHREVSVQ